MEERFVYYPAGKLNDIGFVSICAKHRIEGITRSLTIGK